LNPQPSALNLNRVKHRIRVGAGPYARAQNCTAFHSVFDDTGIIGISGVADPGYAGDMVNVMAKELKAVAAGEVTAKVRRTGQTDRGHLACYTCTPNSAPVHTSAQDRQTGGTSRATPALRIVHPYTPGPKGKGRWVVFQPGSTDSQSPLLASPRLASRPPKP